MKPHRRGFTKPPGTSGVLEGLSKAPLQRVLHKALRFFVHTYIYTYAHTHVHLSYRYGVALPGL